MECPICENEIESLYHNYNVNNPQKYHHWCENCNHGWYIADLKDFTGMCIRGKREEARQIIIKKDSKEKKEMEVENGKSE